MAALSTEVKAFIVQSLACFEAPTKVIDLVKAEFGVVVSRQQVSQYSPGNAMSAKLSQKWIDLFHASRDRFQNEISDIPIANKAYRLRVLDRMMTNAEKIKNIALAAEIIEQAAKECGDSYTNKHKLEHSGPNGSAISVFNYTPADYAAAQQQLEAKLDGLD